MNKLGALWELHCRTESMVVVAIVRRFTFSKKKYIYIVNWPNMVKFHVKHYHVHDVGERLCKVSALIG